MMNAPNRALLSFIPRLVCLILLSLSWNSPTSAFTSLQSQTTRRRLDKNNGHFLFFADAAAESNNNHKNINSKDQVPFVIERISDTPSHYVFEEIAEMCIDVFFNDDPNPNAYVFIEQSFVSIIHTLFSLTCMLITVHGNKYS